MAEYHDLGTNLTHMLGTLDDNHYTLTSFLKSLFWHHDEPKPVKASSASKRKPISPQLIKVRDSICIVGHDWQLIQYVKGQISSLVDHPLPLESLHVKKDTDFKEGALLVPKVILVAKHCPGKKLIDDDGNQGILDDLYDEVCNVGADLLVIYAGLPRAVYPPMRHMVYHPRMAQLLFSTHPTLRSLAETYSLITITEKTNLTSMQKNVIREWLTQPVEANHSVYDKAHEMLKYALNASEIMSETEVYHYQKPLPYYGKTQYLSATEEHASVDSIEKKRKRKKSKKLREAKCGVLVDIDAVELGVYKEDVQEMDKSPVGSVFL